ncbi:MAG: hypothetical protein AAGD35_08300 [Actinomycetota bacterium]
MGRIRRDQLPTAAVFALGAVVMTALAIQSGNWFSWTFLAVFLGVAVWAWPGRRGAHTAHAEAMAAAGDDDVIVYWRPG